MPSYKVQLPANTPGLTLKEGHDIMFVEAADAADAKSVAAGHYDGDSAGAWALATATLADVAADLSPVTVLGSTTKFKLTVTITGGTVNDTFSYECVATDTVDDMWAALPALLNANADIAGAAWATPNLTCSDIADGIGDHTVVAEVTYGGVALASFVGAITDGGIAGAALVVAGVAAPVIPSVVGTARLR